RTPGKDKGKIVFQWVPSHCGLWGNERADFLAKKGGTGILQNFRRDLTLHSAKLEIKRIFRESFRLTASRVARDKPWITLCKKSHGIPSSPRAAAVAKFRLLTGHDCLCAHLFRFNLVTSPICVLCDTGQDMTAAHLDECSALNDLNCIVKSSFKLVGCRTRHPKLSRICSIGDKSGDRVDQGRVVTVRRHPFSVRPNIVLVNNGFWELLHEWKHIWLQDVVDIPLVGHGALDQY
ncbi:uncharacterized protein LOC103524116, partial [Trichonephila clavipes]